MGGSAAPGRWHPVVRIAVGLVFVLLAGIVAVVASEPSEGDTRPIVGGERSHAFIGRTADGEPFRWDPCSTITTRLDADQFVSGAIVINASAGLQDGFDRAPSVGTVLQHELGHVVGLGYILDPFQLMSPVPVVTDWGRGDLAGLEELGEGRCLDVPTAEYQTAIHPTP